MKHLYSKPFCMAGALALALVSSVALMACNEQGASGSKSAAKSAELNCPELPFDSTATGEFDPVASKDARPCGTITLWGSSMPKSFNMWEDYNSFSAELMSMMFEPLVSLHSTEDREVGILADSWSVSEDGRTFTFHVDSRAKWSDGKPVTAEDVQYYYDVIMDEKNLTPIFKVGLSRFDRPEVVDSLTVKMTAKESHWGNFWEAAGMLAFPKHAWASKDFNQIRYEFPVVSGPYKIKTFREDRYVELARRADWWGFHKNWNRGKYNFEKIRYRFMNDQTKALEAFKKQGLQITEEEAADFIENVQITSNKVVNANEELSDEELAEIAGGSWLKKAWKKAKKYVVAATVSAVAGAVAAVAVGVITGGGIGVAAVALAAAKGVGGGLFGAGLSDLWNAGLAGKIGVGAGAVATVIGAAAFVL